MKLGTSGNDQRDDKPAGAEGSRGDRCQQCVVSVEREVSVRIYGQGEGWVGSSLCSPHAGPAALGTLGHFGGSGVTAGAGEQQRDELLSRQDSKDSSFRAHSLRITQIPNLEFCGAISASRVQLTTGSKHRKSQSVRGV